jgi:hypothetical protein
VDSLNQLRSPPSYSVNYGYNENNNSVSITAPPKYDDLIMNIHMNPADLKPNENSKV